MGDELPIDALDKGVLETLRTIVAVTLDLDDLIEPSPIPDAVRIGPFSDVAPVFPLIEHP